MRTYRGEVDVMRTDRGEVDVMRLHHVCVVLHVDNADDKWGKYLISSATFSPTVLRHPNTS